MYKIAVYPKFVTLITALLVSALLAACGGQDPILGIGPVAAVAPTVTSVAPADKAVGVAINLKEVTAEFSETVASVNASGASFAVTCASPCSSPTGTVTLDSTNRIATFEITTAGNLAKNTQYTATITGVQSMTTGLTLLHPFVWHFKTGVTVAVNPTVLLTVPATTSPGPTLNVPANTAITATFSGDMAPLSIKASSFTVKCSAPCVSPAGAVSYSVGSKTAVFTPSAPLAVGDTYTATVTTAAVSLAGLQLSGNQGAVGAVSDYIWTFKTAAAIAGHPVTVLSTIPADLATTGCPGSVSATFTVFGGLKMDPLSLTTTTFTLTGPGPGFTPVIGTVALDSANTGKIATFTPSNPLTGGVVYFATVLGGPNGVKDLAVPANTMTNDKTWSFTAGPASGTCAASINMGLATPFADAAIAGVQNTPTAPITTIHGSVVLDPNFTCNSVSVPNNGTFGLCGGSPPVLVGGQVITNTFPNTTDSAAIMADLNTAFLHTCFPGRPAASCSLGTGATLATLTLGAITGSAQVTGQNYFTAGVYTSASSIDVHDDITLDAQNDPNAVFIFQAGSSLTIADGSIPTHTRIILKNGAKASNVWWSVGSSAVIGVQSEFNGNVLSAFDITLKTGAVSCGRMMAGAWVGAISSGLGALVFDSNSVAIPGTVPGCN